MGVFSKHHRYREAGERTNVSNASVFGEPFKSLFTSTKVFTLHNHIDITDENEKVVYQARSRLLSLRDKTDIVDSNGKQVAHIEKKLLSLHERHFVTMADGSFFEISNELFHLIRDISNIEGLGWQLRGNILGLNFRLYDRNEEIVAVISQKLFSLHDKYCIDIYKPQYEKITVAILVTLQHMIRDRENAASAPSSSSSASSNG